MGNIKEIAEFLSAESFRPRRENQVLTCEPVGKGWSVARSCRKVATAIYGLGQPYSFWNDLHPAQSVDDILATFSRHEWPHRTCRRMVVFLNKQSKNSISTFVDNKQKKNKTRRY